jgi:hypothetical protein
MVSELTLEPPAFVLWLATGRRRLSLRRLRAALVVPLLFFGLGPAASAAPAASAVGNRPLPAPILSTGLHPTPVSGPTAEQLIGEPLLDSAALRRQTRDLGLWAAGVTGPYGKTAVVFHVLATTRHTWLTILELHSERPLTESPWDLIAAQAVMVNGQRATVYQQRGSTTVAWQETPTLHVSLSEDSEVPLSLRDMPNSRNMAMLGEGQLLQLAASLHPRGIQLGPFLLDPPW